jgi:hypothetical protein
MDADGGWCEGKPSPAGALTLASAADAKRSSTRILLPPAPSLRVEPCASGLPCAAAVQVTFQRPAPRWRRRRRRPGRPPRGRQAAPPHHHLLLRAHAGSHAHPRPRPTRDTLRLPLAPAARAPLSVPLEVEVDTAPGIPIPIPVRRDGPRTRPPVGPWSALWRCDRNGVHGRWMAERAAGLRAAHSAAPMDGSIPYCTANE